MSLGFRKSFGNKPRAAKGVKDKTADGGSAAFGGSTDARSLVGGATEKHGGSGFGGPSRLPRQKRIRLLKPRERGKEVFFEGHRPHDDVQHIAAQSAVFQCREVAHVTKLFLRAVNEQRGAIRHERTISNDIDESNAGKT